MSSIQFSVFFLYISYKCRILPCRGVKEIILEINAITSATFLEFYHSLTTTTLQRTRFVDHVDSDSFHKPFMSFITNDNPVHWHWEESKRLNELTWWRHQTETFSALLALCAGIHRSPVNSLHKVQWRGALMFSLIGAWISSWVNNCEAGDLRRQHAHYDVIVMTT